MNDKIIIWSAADGAQQETTLDSINARFDMSDAFDVVTNKNGKQFYLFYDNPLDVVEYDSQNNVKYFVVVTNIDSDNINNYKKKLQQLDRLADLDDYQEIIYKN